MQIVVRSSFLTDKERGRETEREGEMGVGERRRNESRRAWGLFAGHALHRHVSPSLFLRALLLMKSECHPSTEGLERGSTVVGTTYSVFK